MLNFTDNVLRIGLFIELFFLKEPSFFENNQLLTCFHVVVLSTLFEVDSTLYKIYKSLYSNGFLKWLKNTCFFLKIKTELKKKELNKSFFKSWIISYDTISNLFFWKSYTKLVTPVLKPFQTISIFLVLKAIFN